MSEEHFDILDSTGALTGVTAARSRVHAEGLFHRAVHVWLFCPSTNELLVQERALCKDSWPGRWDVSSAGHVSAGGNAIDAAVRELEEELGVAVPPDRFKYLYTHLEKLSSVQRGKPFINNEFNEVFVIQITAQERKLLDPTNAVLRDLPQDFSPSGLRGITSFNGFKLQKSEVSAVQWISLIDAETWWRDGDDRVVPCTNWPSYGRIFKCLRGEEIVENAF